MVEWRRFLHNAFGETAGWRLHRASEQKLAFVSLGQLFLVPRGFLGSLASSVEKKFVTV